MNSSTSQIIRSPITERQEDAIEAEDCDVRSRTLRPAGRSASGRPSRPSPAEVEKSFWRWPPSPCAVEWRIFGCKSPSPAGRRGDLDAGHRLQPGWRGTSTTGHRGCSPSSCRKEEPSSWRLGLGYGWGIDSGDWTRMCVLEKMESRELWYWAMGWIR